MTCQYVISGRFTYKKYIRWSLVLIMKKMLYKEAYLGIKYSSF